MLFSCWRQHSERWVNQNQHAINEHKGWSQKNVTTVMTIVTNKACIGRLHDWLGDLRRRSDTFDKRECNFGEGNFSGGVMKNFLAVRWGFSTILSISWKDLGGRGQVHTRFRQQSNIKGEVIFSQKGDTGGIKLEDDPPGHDFVLGI